MTSMVPPCHSNIASLATIAIDRRRCILFRCTYYYVCNNVTVHFILLCETFLTNNNADLFSIPGYNFVHMSRTKLSRGGVAMYISHKYNYVERLDLCINVEGEFESIAIEVDTGQKASNLIVAEIYRVPNTNENMSIERYDRTIAMLSGSNRDIIIGTDQNFDYMKVNEHKNTSDLLNVFFYCWNTSNC